jgi:hypothetical protein
MSLVQKPAVCCGPGGEPSSPGGCGKPATPGASPNHDCDNNLAQKHAPESIITAIAAFAGGKKTDPDKPHRVIASHAPNETGPDVAIGAKGKTKPAPMSPSGPVLVTLSWSAERWT